MLRILPLLCCSSLLLAQSQVRDVVSMQPIPFATAVNFDGSGGAVADESGYFPANWPPAIDSMKISAIGYVDTVVRYEQVPKILHLQPLTYRLTTATVNADRFDRERHYGKLPRNEKLVVQFLGRKRGAQIGRRIDLRRESYLKRVAVSVVTNTYGSARCRLNFYPIQGDSILSTPINRRDILLAISGSGNFVVDLSEEDMVNAGPILISLELLEAPERQGIIYLGGQLFGPGTLVRRGPGLPWRPGQVTGPVSLSPGIQLTVLE